jgi:3-deoxy-D-manno-octulosonate 8-phosphate phosphatase (KDO 8-P phosphatase)
VTRTTGNKLPGTIRLAAFDIDGVFTDGRFYLSDDNVETKSFFTQDGFGIRRLLKSGIGVAVISGRNSRAVELRMAELGVQHVLQGVSDKVAALEGLLARLQLLPEQCVYTGDDVPDLPLLGYVGYSIAVANAVREVKDACDYTTRQPGGHGAVREVCDLILTRENPHPDHEK